MTAPTIKSTNDYSKFSTILGNRLVNKKKVERIVNDIQNGLNMLPYCPIVVYRGPEKLKIVDGQHRFNAAVQAKESIYYVECDQMDLAKIARINSRSDKWKNSDFLECYIQLGVADYVTLLDFIKKYKIIYSASVAMLMNGVVMEGGSSKSMELFRTGEFNVKHKAWSYKIADLALEVFGRYKFWNDRGLLGAIVELKKSGKCDFGVLKKKIKSAPNLMEKKANVKEYLYLIERVYNHNNSKRIALF